MLMEEMDPESFAVKQPVSWSWSQNRAEQEQEVDLLSNVYPEEERFRVLREPNEEDPKSCYVFSVTVPVKTEKDTVIVNIQAQDYGDRAPNLTALNPSMRPEFMRSVSGSHWNSSVEVSELTPITLNVSFPESYPSDDPPVFTISCLWLELEQIELLCTNMDSLWEEMIGSPILYNWIDWLENSAFSFLGLGDHITLSQHSSHNHEVKHQRAVCERSNPENDLMKLISYNMDCEVKKFMSSYQNCAICFDEKLGQEFFRILECKHHFCRQCAADYCKLHVTEGTVQQLICPVAECKVTLSPHIIKASTDTKLYERYERLVLERGLDIMQDAEWCPRCKCLVIRETTGDVAHCIACRMSFCTECRKSWHPGSPCFSFDARPKTNDAKEPTQETTKDAQVDEKLEDNEDNTEQSINNYIENKELDLFERQSYEEYMTRKMILDETKPCPNCRWRIDKISGCNFMRCSRCLISMCWVCGEQIESYSHLVGFGCINQTPNDVPPNQNPLPVRRLVVKTAKKKEVPKTQGQIKTLICSNCRYRIPKSDTNNHLRCPDCKTNYCWQCKAKINGTITVHFTAGKGACKQHSTEAI